MSEKTYIQLELGGVNRGMKFNMNTYGCINEITGADPFTIVPKSESYNDVLDFIKIIIHAALLSNCKSKKVEADFDSEAVSEWVGEMAPEDVFFVLALFQRQSSSLASTEGSNGAQRQASNVGGGN